MATAKTIEAYIQGLEGERGETAQALCALVAKAVPKAEGAIKWAQPVWSLNGPMLFLRAAKKHVTFGFWRGTELDDPKGLLEGSGDKMRHVKLASVGAIKKGALTQLIKQAARLNREHGDPTKR